MSEAYYEEQPDGTIIPVDPSEIAAARNAALEAAGRARLEGKT